MLRKRCSRHREIEQQIDPKSRIRVTKVDARGPVQANATDRYTTTGDRGGHFSDLIEAGDQLEPVFVQDIDDGFEALARMGDDEVEVSCDPLRSQDHQRHATYKDGFEASVGQRLDDSPNGLQVRVAAVHIMTLWDRCPGSGH